MIISGFRRIDRFLDSAADQVVVGTARLGADIRSVVTMVGGLHESLAHGWVEQNTGITPVLQRGAVPRCYRVTTAGQRAFKHVRSWQDSDTEYDSAAA